VSIDNYPCDRVCLMNKSELDELTNEIERELYSYIGPLLFGKHLYGALGFSNHDAFRQALSRKTIPVEIFSLPNRRGRFALSRDVARWLANERLKPKKIKEEILT
jgi:hypothetical protein